MATPFTCKTASQPGNLVLGILFLACTGLLVLTPCLALAGTLVGSVAPPRDGHDALGALCALGVLMVMALGTLGLGVLCLHATLLPKRLEISDEGIHLYWFRKELGRVPFANMREVIVKTRAMAGETADKAFWQASFAGGWIAGMVARRRFDPNEPIGFIIKLADADDPDTFWPKKFFGGGINKRLDVPYYWKVKHDRLVQKIAKALARYEEDVERIEG